VFDSNLIEQTCGATPPAGPSEFSVDTTDRFGNVLPTIIVNSNTTLDWRARDFRDVFLGQVTALNPTKENAINNLCDSLVAADLMKKIIWFAPLIGDNAADNSLNLDYPYNKYSQKVLWGGSPTHGAGFVQGNGTTSYGKIGLGSSALDPTNYSFGFFSLDTNVNPATIGEMGFSGNWNNGTYLQLSSSGVIGGSPAFCNKLYGDKLQAILANASGLIMGHVSSTRRAFSRNSTILAQSAASLGIYQGQTDDAILLGYYSTYSNRRIGAYIISDHLENAQITDLSNIINQFITDKGAVII
jgi:hypothetical protein